MSAEDVLIWVGGVIVACLVPATGWLVRDVINQRSRLEAIQTVVNERGEVREKIETALLALNGTMGSINASVATLVERTEQFQRVLDRHERYLEADRK